MDNAAGGTSQRLHVGGATVRDRSKKPCWANVLTLDTSAAGCTVESIRYSIVELGNRFPEGVRCRQAAHGLGLTRWTDAHRDLVWSWVDTCAADHVTERTLRVVLAAGPRIGDYWR